MKYRIVTLLLLSNNIASAFVTGRHSTLATSTFSTTNNIAVETTSLNNNNKNVVVVESIKDQLKSLSHRTNRGFQSSSEDRKTAKELIYQLAQYSRSSDPARPYYDRKYNIDGMDDDSTPTISGKWELIYTDAPDITGLDTSRNPFSTAKLGRIGQECSPPYIKNVIEWLRPDWADGLPFSGSSNSRVLQKVVTSALASPDKPLLVDLKVAGLEINAASTPTAAIPDETSNNVFGRIQKDGIPSVIFSVLPVDLKGPLNPPFGQFEILYIDDELRVIRTGQNYLAANMRIQNEEDQWF
jgi:hypothetical protein